MLFMVIRSWVTLALLLCDGPKNFVHLSDMNYLSQKDNGEAKYI